MGQKARSTRPAYLSRTPGERSHAVEGEEPKSTHPPNRDVAHSSSTEISGQLSDETEQPARFDTCRSTLCPSARVIETRENLVEDFNLCPLIEAVAVISRHPDGIT